MYFLCVAKNDLDSLLNIGVWMEEIRAIAPKTPILIVLTKADLDASSESEDQQYERHQFEYYKKVKSPYNADQTFVTMAEVNKVVELYGLQGAFEVSAADWNGYEGEKAFRSAIELALAWKGKP